MIKVSAKEMREAFEAGTQHCVEDKSGGCFDYDGNAYDFQKMADHLNSVLAKGKKPA